MCQALFSFFAFWLEEQISARPYKPMEVRSSVKPSKQKFSDKDALVGNGSSNAGLQMFTLVVAF